MVVRRIDIEGNNLQRQGQLGIWGAPCLGQEAAQVGSARALAGRLRLPLLPRARVIHVRAGMEVLSVLGLFRGATLSGWDPQRHKVAQYSIPIGTQALHAVGYAVGAKWDGAEVRAVAHFGDGATSEGDVSEAFNFAAVHSALVVFSRQTNQGDLGAAGQADGRAGLQAAFGFGFPGVQGGRQRRPGRVRSHQGGGRPGPRRRRLTLIEAITYRLGAHTTTDDPTRYRTSDELDMEGPRADRPLPGLPGTGRAPHRGVRGRGPGRGRPRRPRSGPRSRTCLVLPLSDLVDHVYADLPATLLAQWARRRSSRPSSRPRREGGTDGAEHHGPGAQHRLCGTPWRPTTGWSCSARTSALLGGVFRITDGLLKDFGEQRVMDTPLAESAIMGVSIGLALRGYRPVPEMQFDGFSYPALDQIISHLAKYLELLGRHPADAGGLPHPLRRGHRGRRAPLREPRDDLLPHRRPQGGDPVLGRRRLLAAAPVHRD